MATLVGTSSAANAGDPLTAEQRLLYEKAESTVKNYLAAGKPFPLFAMSVDAGGHVISFLPTDEFKNQKSALVGILEELIPQAREGKIRANVLVTPMSPEPGTETSFAVFDLEQRGAKRIVVMLPYQLAGKPTFGDTQIKLGAPPKLFQP